ncbi:MAG: HdeD family acid-resistance protein [Halieaceae bacterium]|jgi:uncharacterized membrane protein HdeD (DUF308 family)|nr:HdeD family acid-resistance protein [Halieaceae bacterium]
MEPGGQGAALQSLGNIRRLCKRAWWVFLLGVIASVIFGILAFINPAIALAVLALYFAAWVLVDGVVNIIGAIQNRENDGWVLVLLMGVVGVLVGAYALLNPPVSMLAFLYVVSFMALTFGVLMITLGRKVREEIDREWVLYLTGALSVLFGVLIIFQPESVATSVVWMMATWAIITGVLRIVFALFVKNLPEHVGKRLDTAR